MKNAVKVYPAGGDAFEHFPPPPDMSQLHIAGEYGCVRNLMLCVCVCTAHICILLLMKHYFFRRVILAIKLISTCNYMIW